MKAKTTILPILSTLLSCLTSHGQKIPTYIIDGKINGLRDSTEVYLVSSKSDTINKATVLKNKFKFIGHIEGGANYYFLRLDTTTSKLPSKALWIDNSSMQILGTIKDWPTLSLIGSEPHNEYMELIRWFQSAKLNKRETDTMLHFIKTHPNSLYVADLIIKMAPILLQHGMKNSYNNLTDRAKSSFHGLRLKKEIMQGENAVAITKSIHDNTPIINFTFSLSNNDTASILDIASQSKYTLIDFWASWCGPCISAIPEMRRTYETFHKMGFNIVSISIDKKTSDWEKALIQHKTAWVNGIDNIDNIGEKILNLSAIPAYILLDNKGRITKSEYLSKSRHQTNENDTLKLSKNLFKIIDELL